MSTHASFFWTLPILLIALVLGSSRAWAEDESPASQPAWAQSILKQAGPDAVVYVLDGAGAVLLEQHADRPFLPASTLKVFTALLAFERLGGGHRFHTDFFLDEDRLILRGEGDPFLVSEELDLVVEALAPKIGDRTLSGVFIDNSRFEADLSIPGVGATDEPYDALNGATSVNFNTVYLHNDRGTLRSGEPQTPLTPLAREVAAKRKVQGKARVNLSSKPEDVLRYAAELVAAKLRAKGVSVGKAYGPVMSPDGVPLYRHKSSKTLAELSSAMLHFSNNFIANQLFLAVGAKRFGWPASLAKGVRAAHEFRDERPEFSGLVLHEGSGISYDNRATAKSLAAVLLAFEPHVGLLKVHEGSPHKTGTLKVAKTLTGFLDSERHGKVRYVLGLGAGGYFVRWELVKALRRAL